LQRKFQAIIDVRTGLREASELDKGDKSAGCAEVHKRCGTIVLQIMNNSNFFP
jgi:hypothetical protein